MKSLSFYLLLSKLEIVRSKASLIYYIARWKSVPLPRFRYLVIRSLGERIVAQGEGRGKTFLRWVVKTPTPARAGRPARASSRTMFGHGDGGSNSSLGTGFGSGR